MTPLSLLLLIPLSTALGLWWLDHARTIDRIGAYLREHLWPRIIEWPREDDRPQSYEEVVVRTSRFDQGTLIAPFLLIELGYGLRGRPRPGKEPRAWGQRYGSGA